jgi:hypothetical protein
VCLVFEFLKLNFCAYCYWPFQRKHPSESLWDAFPLRGPIAICKIIFLIIFSHWHTDHYLKPVRYDSLLMKRTKDNFLHQLCILNNKTKHRYMELGTLKSQSVCFNFLNQKCTFRVAIFLKSHIKQKAFDSI